MGDDKKDTTKKQRKEYEGPAHLRTVFGEDEIKNFENAWNKRMPSRDRSEPTDPKKKKY